MFTPNNQQVAVIHEVSNPCLVIAGAGSGKTATICQKIQYLLSKNVAQRILGLTFTNKAAKEMQHRLHQASVHKKNARIMTFHKLGLIIFQKFYKDLGFRSGFTLIDHSDRQQLIEQLRPDWPKDRVEQAVYYISHCKQHADPINHSFHQNKDNDFHEILHEYMEIMLKINSIDVDDLILHSFEILKNPERQSFIHKQFDYIFVDEYQDTNEIQYQFFLQLQHEGRFTVVGDDDQSIYTWRGANPNNLIDIKRDFDCLQVLKLEENFRCNAEILKAANKLIAQNHHHHVKQLWSNKNINTPSIWLFQSPSKEAEISSLISDIQKNSVIGDHAILLRTNYQMVEYEKALKEARIPYKILGGASFFQKSVIMDIISYLRLIINPEDNLAFKRIINIPRRNIGPKKLSVLMDYSAQYSINSLLQCCGQFRFLSQCDRESLIAFTSFDKLIRHYQKKFHEDSDISWIHDLLQEIDYYGWIEKTYDHSKAIKAAINSLNDFLAWLERSFKKDPNLENILRKMMITDLLENSERESHALVTLATIHSVKGLEFNSVYLPECLELIIPHKESGENITEERRLMYVAMTRAKYRLNFSYSAIHKDGTVAERSRFLDEIEIDLFSDALKNQAVCEITDWSQLKNRIHLLLESNQGRRSDQ